MLSRFFIHRPIFAAVLSIVIVLAGVITLTGLPIAQYPTLAPPTVKVSATYPGANATVLAESVAIPIEEQVNGVEDMLYMSSVCSSDGTYALTITFASGTDLDMAQVQTQNRVAQATPKLPEEVKRLGVTTKKQSPDFALMVSVVSDSDLYDELYLSNFATTRLKDRLARISGVGDVQLFALGDYSMRIWLDPAKLKARQLTTNDVVNAIREQNVQVAAGAIGKDPAPPGQVYEYTVKVSGRLRDVEQFEQIIVRTGDRGEKIHVGDVAQVELGPKEFRMYSSLNGMPAATLAIYQLPGANLLEISEAARSALDEMAETFPEGIRYEVPYDASTVVVVSIKEIVETLLIAAALVILTVFIFLQDWRTTIIPTITIPVSLIGTFAVMGVLGFSVNTLTMFGLVLAIGIVVDDAIVVVENVMRNIDESGMSPKEATERAMEEVTGPVVATTLVLLAVFVPTAFMGGLTGVLYNQFGLTIATATVFSSVNALTLAPALCGILLRKSPEGKRNPLFRAFNFGMDKSTTMYTGIVGMFVRRSFLTVIAFAGVLVAAWFGLVNTPTGFVPDEDQGYAIVNVKLPDAASAERTRAVCEQVSSIMAEEPDIASRLLLGGFSAIEGAGNSNTATFFMVMKPWDERPEPSQHIMAVIQRLNVAFQQVQGAIVLAFNTPPLPGLGTTGGFDLYLQDRADMGLEQLAGITQEFIDAGNSQAGLTALFSGFRANVPELFVDIDREKVKNTGIPLQDVFDTLQAYLGSVYVNDFNRFGRIFQVNVQAEAQYRANPEDIRKLDVRNKDGRMVPLGALSTVDFSFGTPLLTRYNMFTAANVKGSPAPGFSSGQALAIVDDMAKASLPSSMGHEWTGISFQQRLAGNAAPLIFSLAVLLVYLVLAAQYESWAIPWAVILAVPIGIMGAMFSVMARGLFNDTYTQIGLVLLVALVSKNSILIVEFAREKRAAGLSVREAAAEAARLRFRPILMTAFSFVLGTLPLVIASGAGAGSRQALGTAVFGGMIVATVFGVILTPGIYVVIQGGSEWLARKRGGAAEPSTPQAPSIS